MSEPVNPSETSSSSKEQDLRHDIANALSQRLPERPTADDIQTALDEMVSDQLVAGAVSQEAYFVGPLPSPDTLIAYNKAVPDAAERILRNFEIETDHRHKNESRRLVLESIYAFFGLFSGWSILAGAMVAACVLALNEQQEVAVAALSVSLIGVVGKIIEQRLSRHPNEDADNSEQP